MNRHDRSAAQQAAHFHTVAHNLVGRRDDADGSGLGIHHADGCLICNDGDPKHNPEFTTVELYQAYADFHDMMDIAEGIISGAAQEILGTYEIEWMGEKINLAPGWRRLSMVDAVKE